ncbi:hypothetical protein BGZ52_005044, partial [Haplosporangium bisporale]
LLLVATTSEAAVLYRINNGDSWAKNFPPGAGRPPFLTEVIVDNGFASVYERWTVEPFEEGFRIANSGTGFWLTAHNEEVYGSSDFDPASSKWYIERAGDGKFKILRPNKDLVITALRARPDNPVTLFLQSANGSDDQLWSFERIS